MHKDILEKNKSDADKTEVERTLDAHTAEMAALQEAMATQKNKAQLKT